MAQHDYLSAVLPEGAAGFSPAAVPPQAELERRAARLDDIGDQLDLVHLDEAERGEVGPPSTVDEREQNEACAAATDVAPELLTAQGHEATLLRDALDLEEALLQLREANRKVLEASRTGALLLGAELTELNDRVEDAVAQGRGAATEAERNEHDAIFAPVTQIRQGDHDAELRRGQRRTLRRAREEMQVRAAKAEPRRLLQAEALRSAPLPLAASRAARRATDRGKTGRSKKEKQP